MKDSNKDLIMVVSNIRILKHYEADFTHLGLSGPMCIQLHKPQYPMSSLKEFIECCFHRMLLEMTSWIPCSSKIL